MKKPLLATIAICTYNRVAWLEQCLGSLRSQLEGLEQVEVLVIDNNSFDGTASLVHGLMSTFPQLRYAKESQQGLSHARNHAVAESRAPWICLLDDDAKVLPEYVRRLCQHAIDGSYDCIGGVYEAWYPEGREAWFRDSYASNAGVSDAFSELPTDRYASGGIMLLRKSAVQAAGGFMPEVGMKGRGLSYGEETRLQIQMRRSGARIAFDPDWRIKHRVSQDKQRFDWQLRSAWAIGRDSWLAFDCHPGTLDILGLFWRFFSRPARGIAREFVTDERPRTWQTYCLAVLKPLALTLAQLSMGIRLYFSGESRS